MKRNLYFTLMVLFILSACQPSPDGQGQAATATQAPTLTLEPTSTWTPVLTLTPESIQIVDKIPIISKETLQKNINPYEYENYFKNNGLKISSEYSSIKMDDFTSGEIIKKEQEFISKHPPFSGKVKNNGLWVPKSWSDVHNENMVAFFSDYLYVFNPTMRHLKLISIYKIDDENFFTEIGVNLSSLINDPYYGLDMNNITEDEKRNAESMYFWLATWAYQNPDGDVKLIHAFVQNFYLFTYDYLSISYDMNPYCDTQSSFMPRFVYDYKFKKNSDSDEKNRIYHVLGFIYENRPDLKPDNRLVGKWVETREFHDDLQNKLFGYEDGFCW